MRLFVAVSPPPSVVSVLAALERPVVEGVRWTAPEQWHVTLRFLGEVPSSAVGSLVSSLSSAASGLSAAAGVVGERLAAFGPSVLHVPVDGFAPWAAAVEAAVGELGVGVPARPGSFVGHLTLARGRRGRGPSRGDVRPLVGRVVPWAEGGSSWVASAFTLVRSDLGPGGAAYSPVASFEVGGEDGGEHPHTNVRSQLR